MLTLRPLPAYNLQMDWSSNPKEDDEIKSEPEDVKSEPEDVKSEPEGESPDFQSISAEDAVARHFEESLRRLAQLRNGNGPTSNGYHPQSRPNAFVPFMRFDSKPHAEAPPHGLGPPQLRPQSPSSPPPPPQSNYMERPSSSHVRLAEQLSPQPPSLQIPSPYDVANIANILKTFQFNPFTNSSIIKEEIADDDRPSASNGGSIAHPNRPPIVSFGGRWGCLQHPSIIQDVIKTEPYDMSTKGKKTTKTATTTEKNQKRPPAGGKWGCLQKKGKHDGPPVLAVQADVDIEAELPCTSIKQRPPAKPRKRPPAKPKTGTAKTKSEPVKPKSEPAKPKSDPGSTNNDPTSINSDPNGTHSDPAKANSEPTNPISDPAKPNSAPAEPNSDSTKPNTDPVKPKSGPAKPRRPRPKRDPAKRKRPPAKPRTNGATTTAIEKPVRVLKQSNRTTKRKTNYCEASSDEEPRTVFNSRSRSTFKPIQPPVPPIALPVPVDEVKDEPLEIKTEPDDVEVKTEPIEGEIKTEPMDVEIKTELDDTEIKTEPGVEESKTEPMDLEIKTEMLEEIKDEIKDEQLSQPGSPSASLPSTSAAAADSKPKRVRNPAAAAASARNKTKLHPLTKKEQTMMNKLMQSKEPFLQNLPCLKLASRISKCRECRCASLRSDSVFCRFFDFRRLRYNENAILVVDGFSDPNKDPGPSDICLWVPAPAPKDIDMDVCRFILMHVGDQFCRIWQEELTATDEHVSLNKTIAWKKVVKGVREICDVCETTLFNFHWTCSKCGFGVCIDCYKDRKRKRVKKTDKPTRGFDDYGWQTCTARETHEMSALMLTQIIPGNSLNFLAHRLHEVCRLWKIPQRCSCQLNASMQDVDFEPRMVNISNKIMKDAYLRFYSRECEVKYRDKIKGLDPEDMCDNMTIMQAETELIEEAKSAGTLAVVLATTLKHLKLTPKNDPLSNNNTIEVEDAVTKEYNEQRTRPRPQRYLPQKVMTSRVSRQMFPGVDHDWLCHGKLLRLLDSQNKRNVLMFQEVWKRGQPVMVSELCKFLNISLWHPEAFCRDFGEKKNDLINCMTGNLVPNQPMKLFWEGFQCVSKRLLDAQGQPMLLKLKDWPPGDDFAEILPTRFADLMSALPLPEYTLRTGSLNIASRLPNIFVPPDLGPKMYNAYGSALHPDKGTTNLHLDISDAVNIMVYVGIPTDASANEQIKAAMRAIDGGGCDIITRRRAREPGVMPGALWHIYSARDADKIRDLLNRVTIERGFRLEPDHDPIHDQNWYLDNELRERLYDDYGVEGFPIVQCLGDAVFIPAGAPHQVRNLHNCIKVAEDFVSPENIEHCFHLSQQFRKLSMSHTNHEDKLQIRNVIYHAVKDTTSYLTYLLNRQL